MSTGIQWTNETWNPTVGCDKVDRGCKNCYAIRMAWRLAHIPAMKELYASTVKKTEGGAVNWTGEVKMNTAALEKPLGVKKPTMWFVDSMSDLFHEDVPFEYIDKVWKVMLATPHHTYQILTKRPARMKAYFNDVLVQAKAKFGKAIVEIPLPNVWLGVSVNDQKSADERIPLLLQVPAAVRFLSCEPMTGRIDLKNIAGPAGSRYQVLKAIERSGDSNRPAIDWVIAGGESGPGATMVHPDWIRSLRDQCGAHGVAFFFKQWGAWMPLEECAQQPFLQDMNGNMHDGHGLPSADEMEESDNWDNGMWCIEERERMCIFKKVGKHEAGCMLDGRVWQEFPRK